MRTRRRRRPRHREPAFARRRLRCSVVAGSPGARQGASRDAVRTERREAAKTRRLPSTFRRPDGLASTTSKEEIMWWAIGIGGAILYFIVAVTLGVMTLRNGHGWMFFFGIFFPILWIFGAFMKPPQPYAA